MIFNSSCCKGPIYRTSAVRHFGKCLTYIEYSFIFSWCVANVNKKWSTKWLTVWKCHHAIERWIDINTSNENQNKRPNHFEVLSTSAYNMLCCDGCLGGNYTLVSSILPPAATKLREMVAHTSNDDDLEKNPHTSL